MRLFRILMSGGSIPQVSEPQIVFAEGSGNSTISAPIMFLPAATVLLLHQQQPDQPIFSYPLNRGQSAVWHRAKIA